MLVRLIDAHSHTMRTAEALREEGTDIEVRQG